MNTEPLDEIEENHLKEVRILGNQFNFYIDKETEKDFFQEVFSEYSVYFEMDNQVRLIFDLPETLWWRVFLHKEEYGELVTKRYGDRFLVDSDSTCIEYITTVIDLENRELRSGRTYINMNYLVNNEWRKKPDMLLKNYNSLTRRVKKHLITYEEQIKGHLYKNYISSGIKRYIAEGYRLR